MHEPAPTMSLCPRCRHSWHGLQCTVQVRSNGLARNCTCASAFVLRSDS